MKDTTILCVLAFLLTFASLAQVANNNIEDRIRLSVDDDWFQSFTTHSTVEWECVNKALTRSCLIYHNDQWFTFSVDKPGTFYVNISNQQCKNRQGVQIIVIEGDPCKIDTYRLIECISYTDQADMYVPLYNIKPGVEYLVNIDGYLGDLCDFNIQVATRFNGVPAKKDVLDILELEAVSDDSVVTIHWKLPDSLMHRLNSFSLYRQHQLQKGTTLITEIPVERNALGRAIESYRIVDTVRKQGVYEYMIYGASHKEGLLLLSTTNITFRKGSGRKPVSYGINFSYQSEASELISVDVYDDSNDKYLFSTSRRTSKGNNHYSLDLTPYVDVGIVFFKVVLTGKKKKLEQRYQIKKPEK